MPLGIVKVIVPARLDHPYLATIIQHDNFYDFKIATEITLDTKGIKVLEVQWIKITKTSVEK